MINGKFTDLIIKYIWCIPFILSGYFLLIIKNETSSIFWQNEYIENQIEYEKRQINLFKAELSYLGSPARLRNLSDQYLNLSEISHKQIIFDPLTQENKDVLAKIVDLNSDRLNFERPNKKTRYKTIKYENKTIFALKTSKR